VAARAEPDVREGPVVVQGEVDERAKIRALPWCLAHGMLNSVFGVWTFGSSVFLLFLGELGLPKGQIGMLLSLFPFCGLLALGFAPVAARLGRKRVFLLGYGLRKPLMAMLLLLPWVVGRAGPSAGTVFLSLVIAGFAILRALAETAYYPWSQEFIPNRVRGTFSAWFTVLALVASAASLAVAGRVLEAGEGLGRYLWLIGVGSIFGLLGVAVMAKIPGGEPMRDGGSAAGHLANLREALGDRNFVAYLGGLAGTTIGLGLLVSFLPLFVKEQLGLPAATVVRLDVVAMVAGGAASLAWGWLADRVGSRPVLMPAVALLLPLPLAWLILPRPLPHAVAVCTGLYLLYGVGVHGVGIGAGRLLFNSVVPPGKNTAYTAVYYAWLGVTGGIAPLLAGGILAAGGDWRLRLLWLRLDGYALVFILALAFLGLGWWLYGRVRADGRYGTRMALRSFLTRILPR
jgi:MFS family permease